MRPTAAAAPDAPMAAAAAAASSALLDARCSTRLQGHVKAIEWQYQQTGPHEGAIFPVRCVCVCACACVRCVRAEWPCVCGRVSGGVRVCAVLLTLLNCTHSSGCDRGV